MMKKMILNNLQRNDDDNDENYDDYDEENDFEQLAERGGEEAEDGSLGRHQVHFLYFSF